MSPFVNSDCEELNFINSTDFFSQVNIYILHWIPLVQVLTVVLILNCTQYLKLNLSLFLHTTFPNPVQCGFSMFTNLGQSLFLLGHWYPCFGLLVTSALGFKVRMDLLAYVIHWLYATESSDSPLVQHLLTSSWCSMAAEPFPST